MNLSLGSPTPYSLHVYDEVTSTQDVARSLMGSGPVAVVASRQSNGRGRSGAEWQTAPRAMALSVAFPQDAFPAFDLNRLSLLPLVYGLAAATVIDAGLKWPNDLLLDERKVGGILVEVSAGMVVAGCGVNLFWPEPPPDRIGLLTFDPGPNRLVRIASTLTESFLDRLNRGPEEWGIDEYRVRCSTLGRSITWSEGGSGQAFAIDPQNGALLVESGNGMTVRLEAGAVRHIR